MTLTQLAEKVEGMTGPDGRVNAEIACAVKFRDLRPAEPDDHKEYLNGFPPGKSAIWCPSGFLMADSYTSSVDAAMSLIPAICLEPGFPGDRFILVANREDWTCSIQYAANPGHWSEKWDYAKGVAKTPALAITAAALRARQAMEGK